MKFDTIKKGTKYLYINLIRGDQTIQFRDVLNYTAPCSLAEYLVQWGAKFKKSIFPYSLYKSVEELEAAVDFPRYEQFYSELKKVSYLIIT